MRSIIGVTVGAVLISTAVVAPASAQWVEPSPAPNTPPGIAAFVSESGILANYPADYQWAPSGKKIRDTGFKPQDGLSFLNYGNASNALPNEVNTFYLGVPDKAPVNLRAKDVYTLLGKEACIGGKLPCELTLSAQEWQRGVNAGMVAGHCWGIAATVAQLYNGALSMSAIDGKKTVYKTAWNTKMTRQIARNWASQDAIDVNDYLVSARRAITLLKKNMSKGNVPYSIALRSTDGGHGVTPVALYKVAKNKYDIAIYDNNWPGRFRAMHVDTKLNTYAYEMFSLPGAAPVMTVGKMALVPMSVLDAPLPCPFCGGSTAATVHVSPLPVNDDVRVSVADWDGNAIKGLVHHEPTSPGGLVGMREFGKFDVPAGKNFALTIDASKLTEPVETDARVIDGGVTFTLTHLTLTPGAVVTWYVNPTKGYATVKSTHDATFNVTAIDTTGGQEWSFTYGEMFVGKGGEVTVTMYDKKFLSVLSFKGTPTQNIQVLAQASTTGGTQAVISEIYSQAAGGATVAQYKGWTNMKDGKLGLWVAQSRGGEYAKVKYGPLSAVDGSSGAVGEEEEEEIGIARVEPNLGDDLNDPNEAALYDILQSVEIIADLAW